VIDASTAVALYRREMENWENSLLDRKKQKKTGGFRDAAVTNENISIAEQKQEEMNLLEEEEELNKENPCFSDITEEHEQDSCLSDIPENKKRKFSAESSSVAPISVTEDQRTKPGGFKTDIKTEQNDISSSPSSSIVQFDLDEVYNRKKKVKKGPISSLASSTSSSSSSSGSGSGFSIDQLISTTKNVDLFVSKHHHGANGHNIKKQKKNQLISDNGQSRSNEVDDEEISNQEMKVLSFEKPVDKNGKSNSQKKKKSKKYNKQKNSSKK
jgi:hypothetical protein